VFGSTKNSVSPFVPLGWETMRWPSTNAKVAPGSDRYAIDKSGEHNRRERCWARCDFRIATHLSA